MWVRLLPLARSPLIEGRLAAIRVAGVSVTGSGQALSVGSDKASPWPKATWIVSLEDGGGGNIKQTSRHELSHWEEDAHARRQHVYTAEV